MLVHESFLGWGTAVVLITVISAGAWWMCSSAITLGLNMAVILCIKTFTIKSDG